MRCPKKGDRAPIARYANEPAKCVPSGATVEQADVFGPAQRAGAPPSVVVGIRKKVTTHQRRGMSSIQAKLILCWYSANRRVSIPAEFLERSGEGSTMWGSFVLERKLIFMLAALVGTAGVFAADKVYISTDESGQPVVSDRLPATGTVEEVVEMPKSPQSDTTKAKEEVQRVKKMADELAAERKQKEQERATAKEQKERQQVSCAASRSRLEQLESQPPNRRLVVRPDGTAERVSAEEMQSLLDTARRQVVEDCGTLDPPAATK